MCNHKVLKVIKNNKTGRKDKRTDEQIENS